MRGEVTVAVKSERVTETTLIKATDQNSQVLFISSTLLSEPVVWGGTIVMNTKEELNKAFDDLNKGIFLQDKISY